jgi:hypothetical protein
MKHYRTVVVFVLLVVLALSTVLAQDDEGLSETQQHNGQVAQAVVETFWDSTSTQEAMTELEATVFAEEISIHGFFDSLVVDVPNGSLSRRTFNTYFQRLKDMSATVEEVFVAQDAVTVIATIEATVDRSWAMGNDFFLPGSEDPYTWEYVAIFHFNDDGLIDEFWRFFDMPDVEKLG